MKIIAIETSSDGTSVAIVENGRKILANIVASSADMHAKTGGIIPEQAARQQVVSIIPVLSEALKSAGLDHNQIDKIAVTTSPGLIGSLLVGIETARTLSLIWNKPIIPVNHLIAHLYANWLMEGEEPQFPAVAMVVSGGHTDIIMMNYHNDIEWIGGTRDDAAGEAFDKTARLLGLPYPGGPAIGKSAQEYIDNNPNDKLNYFPRPLLGDNNYDLSFSGLKTAVLRESEKKIMDNRKLAAEVQEAIIDVLVGKTIKAVEEYKPKSLLLAGGVSANGRLADRFRKETENIKSTNFFIPPPKLCTDNAAYIASCAFYNQRETDPFEIDATADLSITGQV